MEVHKMGGGINFTVEKCKEASEEELYESLIERLNNFTKSGKKLREKLKPPI
jgi:imidazolonepropionase